MNPIPIPHSSDGTVTTRFDTSPLMSTYLIAFAVTDFPFRANAANSIVPMRAYAAPDRYERTQYALNEGEKAICVLSDYLQMPYTLPKLDMFFVSGIAGGNVELNLKQTSKNPMFFFQF